MLDVGCSKKVTKIEEPVQKPKAEQPAPTSANASDKAKASEFPTVLTAILRQEIGYASEKGLYLTTLTELTDSAELDGNLLNSEYFSYSLDNVTINTFTAHAIVKKKFGQATIGDEATINQYNKKSASANLLQYVPDWR
jgi:hypothetical protein